MRLKKTGGEIKIEKAQLDYQLLVFRRGVHSTARFHVEVLIRAIYTGPVISCSMSFYVPSGLQRRMTFKGSKSCTLYTRASSLSCAAGSRCRVPWQFEFEHSVHIVGKAHPSALSSTRHTESQKSLRKAILREYSSAHQDNADPQPKKLGGRTRMHFTPSSAEGKPTFQSGKLARAHHTRRDKLRLSPALPGLPCLGTSSLHHE